MANIQLFNHTIKIRPTTSEDLLFLQGKRTATMPVYGWKARKGSKLRMFKVFGYTIVIISI